MDTESPVIWPSWCYSGDATPGSDSIIDTPSSVPPSKRRRRLERLNGAVTSLSTTPTLSNTTSTITSSPSDYTSHNNNNNTSTSNNNQSQLLKHERLSPGTPDTSSRSLTPSSASHPDTPPVQDMLGGLGGGSPLLARNYSDIMRSLAAKYNNANPNDYFSRNGFPSSTTSQLAQPPPQSDRYKSPLHPSIPPYPSFPSAHLPPSTSSSNSSTDLKSPSPNYNNSKPSTKASTNSSGPSIQPCGTPGPTSGDYGQQQPMMNPFTAAAAASGIFPPLIDMSSTQALLALVRTAKEAEMERLIKTVKPRVDSPLDLSSAGSTGNSNNGNKKQPKIVKTTSTPAIPIGLNVPGFPSSSFPSSEGTSVAVPRPISSSPQPPKRSESATPPRSIQQQSLQEDITWWTVDDVCKFVAGIDICAEYEQNFREQSIDGSGLPLLTEEHLVNTIRMRLGPALKLRSLLAKKIGSCTVCLHCNHCHKSSTSAHGRTATASPSAGASSVENRTIGTNKSLVGGESRLNTDCKNVIRRNSNASGEGGSEGEEKGLGSPQSN